MCADNQLLSGHELARRAAVSEPTIRTWRTKRGLPHTNHLGSYNDLLSWCAEQTFPGCRKILAREAEAGDRTPRPGAPPGRGASLGVDLDAADLETLRHVARAARNSARDHLDALVAAAEAHAEILRHLRDAYAEVDDVLVTVTAPTHPHD